jgi:aminobutyraldehyde dehydrogenase
LTVIAAPDLRQEMDIGPLISAAQRERVAGFVERAAAARHVEIVTGSQPGAGSGFYYQPTVVAGARQQDEIVEKEVFGPVVPVPALTMPIRRSPGRTLPSTGSPPRSGPKTCPGR